MQPTKPYKKLIASPPIIFGGLAILLLLMYISYRMYVSDRRLIPISALALIAGVAFEGRRLSEKWLDVGIVTLIAFVGSFFVFIPFKREHPYIFENHIEFWPYAFMAVFILASIAYHGQKVVPKLTEGITLLQSVAVIYWVIDYRFINTQNLFLKSLMVVGLLFAAFSIFHAFTYVALSRTNRLILSIWSSIIMLLFAVDNIFRVYQNDQIENADLVHGSHIGLQYFMLGVSSIYIVQNGMMLAGFLPGKGTFFNKKYFQELKELKSEHINRYSDRQVSIEHALFCVIFTGAVFFLNYHYHMLPRHTAIWAVFVIFPFILDLLSSISRQKA